MNSFCIIGLGKFGRSLALSLAAEKKQVLAIDTDADKVADIADFVTDAVVGDPTNEAVLYAAGVRNYECAVICFTENINDNVLLTIMLKDIGVKKVVARAINEGHHRVLERIGADLIVFPEKDMGEKLAFKLTKEKVTEYIEFSGCTLVETEIPSDWAGKDLITLNIRRRYGVNVIAVTSADGKLDPSPKPDRIFKKGDKVLIIGSDEAIGKFTK